MTGRPYLIRASPSAPMQCDICGRKFYAVYVCRDYLRRCPGCYDKYMKKQEENENE